MSLTWEHPCPYLRHSLLEKLAEEITGEELPPKFYNCTFEDTEPYSRVSDEEEEDMALMLKVREDTRREERAKKEKESETFGK